MSSLYDPFGSNNKKMETNPANQQVSNQPRFGSASNQQPSSQQEPQQRFSMMGREQDQPQQGILSRVVRAVANPFGKAAATFTGALEGAGELGAAGLSKLTGDEAGYQGHLKKVVEATQTGGSFGKMIGYKPVGIDQATGKEMSMGGRIADIVGTGAEIGSWFIGGEGGAQAVKTGLKGSMLAAFKTGAKAGLETGALQGFGSALQKNSQSDRSDLSMREKIVDTLKDTAVSAGTGFLIGGVTSAAVPLLSKMIRGTTATFRGANRAVTSATEHAEQSTARTAELKALGPEAERAAETGIDDTVIKFVKGSDPSDKAAYQKMFDVAEQKSGDLAFRGQPKQIVGQTLVEQASFLAKKLKETGAKLGEEKANLAGTMISPAKTRDAIMKDIAEAGLQVTEKKGLQAAEGAPINGDVRDILNDVYKYVSGDKPLDGRNIDRLREYLFQTSSKTGAPLPSNAQRILAKYRNLLLEDVGAHAPNYRALSEQYATQHGVLDEFTKLLGYKGNMQEITEKSLKAGEVAQRVLGNAADRPMAAINDLVHAAQDAGFKGSGNVYNQILFSDLVEHAFGITQPRSLTGSVSRGVEAGMDALGAAADATRGNWLGVVSRGYKYLMGKTSEDQIKALKALIQGVEEGKILPKGEGLPGIPSTAGSEASGQLLNKAENKVPDYLSDKAASSMSGGIAGIEPQVDKDGKFKGFKYNPTKGLLGMVGMSVANKVGGGKFNVKNGQLLDQLESEGARYFAGVDFPKNTKYPDMNLVGQVEKEGIGALKKSFVMKQAFAKTTQAPPTTSYDEIYKIADDNHADYMDFVETVFDAIKPQEILKKKKR